MANNAEAIEAFNSKTVQTIATLDSIKEHLEKHMHLDLHEVNWAHVGSVGHVLELLQQASEFLSLKEVA
jgi:DNA integrity scanning protein DisA with diadenylate cyclase activity